MPNTVNDSGNSAYSCADAVPDLIGPDRGGFIYFITDGEALKIGFSGAPDQRLRDLQAASPRELRIMAKFHGKMSDEQALHQKFGHLRLRGEWFKDNGEIAEHIESLAAKKPDHPDFDFDPKKYSFPLHPRVFGRWLAEQTVSNDIFIRTAEATRLSIDQVGRREFRESALIRRLCVADLNLFQSIVQQARLA